MVGTTVTPVNLNHRELQIWPANLQWLHRGRDFLANVMFHSCSNDKLAEPRLNRRVVRSVILSGTCEYDTI